MRFVEQKCKFNKIGTESKMENPTHSFTFYRDEPYASAHIIIANKSKTVMSWSSRKKREDIFCTVSFVRKEFFQDLCFISIYRVLNAISEYTYFYISKNIT